MPSEPAIESGLRRRVRAGAAPSGAALAVIVAVAATAGLAALIDRWGLLEDTLTLKATLLAAGGGALVLWLAVKHLAAPAFGAANTVTLARGGLTVLLVALLGFEPSAPLGWLLVALGLLAVALDGVDGALARARGEQNAFGARFDMETDALTTVALAALVWQQDKAGAWILLAGSLRYLFVAASYVRPWLGAALPASRRRQTVCVVQIVSLLGALVPFVTWPASAALAGAGLVALGVSFAIDIAWLARHARS